MELQSWDEALNQLKKGSAKKPVIVICYADWCPHCKSKQKMWSKFKNSKKCAVFKIESEKTGGNITAFPTYKINKGGKTFEGNSSEQTNYKILEKDLLGGQDTSGLVNGGRKTRRAFRVHKPLIQKLRMTRRRS